MAWHPMGVRQNHRTAANLLRALVVAVLSYAACLVACHGAGAAGVLGEHVCTDGSGQQRALADGHLNPLVATAQQPSLGCHDVHVGCAAIMMPAACGGSANAVGANATRACVARDAATRSAERTCIDL